MLHWAFWVSENILTWYSHAKTKTWVLTASIIVVVIVGEATTIVVIIRDGVAWRRDGSGHNLGLVDIQV